MRRTGRWLAAVGIPLLALAPVKADRRSSVEAPAPFTNYSAWVKLLRDPHPVSRGLWSLCRSPTEADWAEERKRTGPHTEHLIMVYGNPRAVEASGHGDAHVFSTGAVIAKEKFLLGAGKPDGVGFMEKRSEPEYKDAGGWRFSYYPSTGDARHTQEHCAACHRTAAATDYVFGTYPRAGGWAP